MDSLSKSRTSELAQLIMDNPSQYLPSKAAKVLSWQVEGQSVRFRNRRLSAAATVSFPGGIAESLQSF